MGTKLQNTNNENKNDSNIKEEKRNNIKSKDYNHLWFQESRINTVEMKHNAKRNKLLIQKNLATENAIMLNRYYNSVITLQKEEIYIVTALQRSKI